MKHADFVKFREILKNAKIKTLIYQAFQGL